MGSPIHEVRGRREVGDHPTGRAVVVIGTAHPGPARDPAFHLLLLVPSLSSPRPISCNPSWVRFVAKYCGDIKKMPVLGCMPEILWGASFRFYGLVGEYLRLPDSMADGAVWCEPASAWEFP